jgi:hypothetical protein
MGWLDIGWLEDKMRDVEPRLVDEKPPEVTEVAPRIHQITRELEFPMGMLLPVNMTVIDIGGGRLLLHSPIDCSHDVRSILADLGDVSGIVLPNTFHHLFADQWIEALPDLDVFVAPRLEERFERFSSYPVIGPETPQDWNDTLERLVITDGDRFSEVIFYHKPSQTLILTDIGFNGPFGDNWWRQLLWRSFGVSSSFGPSRTIRWTLLDNVELLAERLRRVLAWEFTKITVAHGPPVEANAREAFELGFSAYLSDAQLEAELSFGQTATGERQSPN